MVERSKLPEVKVWEPDALFRGELALGLSSRWHRVGERVRWGEVVCVVTRACWTGRGEEHELVVRLEDEHPCP
jgi:hypothetical protein